MGHPLGGLFCRYGAGGAEMLELNASTVDEWLTKEGQFSYDFRRHSLVNYRAAGMDVTFSEEILTKVHLEWTALVSHWQNHLFPEDTHSLSYIKIFSILIWCLSKEPYIIDIHEYIPGIKRSEFEFNGSDDLKKLVVEDFLSAPEIICALDFCIPVIKAYERVRSDRFTPFEDALTNSFRHDLIYMLNSGEITALQVYLALEGKFSRV
jgi:hypothetical protein